VTIFANAGHAFIEVAGIVLDTEVHGDCYACQQQSQADGACRAAHSLAGCRWMNPPYWSPAIWAGIIDPGCQRGPVDGLVGCTGV
jgi:hypothetical protein